MTDVFLHMWLNSRISSYVLVYFCITYVIPSGHVQQAVNNTGYTSHTTSDSSGRRCLVEEPLGHKIRDQIQYTSAAR